MRSLVTPLAWMLLAPSGAIYAQDEPAVLVDRPANLEVRGEALIDALRLLQARSGVPIAFSRDFIPTRHVTRCDCLESTVGEALEVLLAGTNLTFVERRNQILITPTSDEGANAPVISAVVGVVRERDGGAPIRSARVEVREQRLATMTDASGRFLLLSVPPGTYNIDVDALGFRSVESLQVEVTGDAPTEVALELARDPLALDEIIVAPGTFRMLEDVALFPQTLTREEMDALPQPGEDVFRMMERMPGIATDDLSARMNVRGGNFDEMLIMLDGTELFEPYHMKDLDAVLGVVDVATLRGVNLVAGGLPIEHGGRMTGLFDMRTLQPIGGGARHSVGVSATNVTARTQGSFAGGRGGWLFSGRRGFMDLLFTLAAAAQDEINNQDFSPRYFDVMGKVELLANSNHRLSAHLLYAGDELNLVDTDFGIGASGDRASERVSLDSDWTNFNLWAGWDWAVSPTLDVSTVVSRSDLMRRRTGEYVASGSGEFADFADVDDRSDFAFATLRQDWRLGMAAGAVLKFGGQVRRASSEYRYRNSVGNEFIQMDGNVGVAYDTTAVTLDPTATESSAYLAVRLQPLDRLTLELGARYDHRSHTGDSDVSPRFQAAIDIGPSTTLRGSWGTYRQSHGVEELSVVDGDTIFFPSEVAKQVALGVQHSFGSGLDARVEAYHRRTTDPRPRYLNVGREIWPFPEVGLDRVRFLPEEGRARGLELLLSGPLGARSQWTATYVLAKAEDRVGNDWIVRTLDQRHTTSLRWHFEPNEKWQLSASWQYHTGWPTTPLEFQVDTIPNAGPDERQVLIGKRPGAINSRRLPAYHRMDLRATRTFDIGRGRLSVFLDVFNLYNRQNLRSYSYLVALPEGTVTTDIGEILLPLLPSFGLTWEF